MALLGLSGLRSRLAAQRRAAKQHKDREGRESRALDRRARRRRAGQKQHMGELMAAKRALQKLALSTERMLKDEGSENKHEQNEGEAAILKSEQSSFKGSAADGQNLPHTQSSCNMTLTESYTSVRCSNLLSYECIRSLGSGSFGTAFVVREIETKALYAVKMIPYGSRVKTRQQRLRQSALTEARNLAKLSHPNIVLFRTCFESENDGEKSRQWPWGRLPRLCIVMDYCESGTLKNAIQTARTTRKKIPCWKQQAWFFQLALALEYLHGIDILHRDLKPGNVFLSGGGAVVKLGDFGLMTLLESAECVGSEKAGTPAYNWSPEILDGLPYDAKVDMWSLGVTMFEIVTLEIPFKGETLDDLAKSIVRGARDPLTISMRENQKLRECVRTISELLRSDPAGRPSATMILQLPWVRDCMRQFLSRRRGLEAELTVKLCSRLGQVGCSKLDQK